MSNLDDALHRAHAVAAMAASAVEGKSVDVTLRKMLAGAAFHLSIEHHRSVVLLVEHREIGSAFALLRPLVEAFASGYWLRHTASDVKVDDFADGRFRPKLDYLLHNVVKNNPGGPTYKVMQHLATTTHDLTHGGVGHLARRMNTTRLGPGYRTDEVVISLDVANWIAGISMLELVGAVIEDETAAAALSDQLFALLKLESRAPGAQGGDGLRA